MLLRRLILVGGMFIASGGCGNSASGTSHGSGAGAGGSADAAAGAGGVSPVDGGGDVQDAGTGVVSCSSPSTGYAHNGSGCGAWRWAVKTGTDQDRDKVDLKPEVTTIQALQSLKTPAKVSYCNRTADELKTYELKDVSLKFERMESDSDYHIIASDAAGRTMLVEVPYPGCVGTNACQSGTPWLCEITHARAAVDAKNPGAKSYAKLGVGSVVGVGFFDTYELGSTYPPNGMAPNGIELHPVLGICFGTGCDPLKE